MIPTWDELVDIAATALAAHGAALDAEQAVRGIDALDETAVHPLLAEGFRAAGFGVFREWPYAVPEGVPLRRERERCDLVLTPGPDRPPRDPVAERVERARAEGTLFAGLPGDNDDRHAGPDETVWVEVKVAGQFAFAAGVPGPSRGYSSLLVGGLRQDIAKLASEEAAGMRAVLLVLFAESQAVTDHDVPAALHRCLDLGLPVGAARRGGFPVSDRIGNRWCAVWIVPVR